MIEFSHSRRNVFVKCKRKYRLHYLEGWRTRQINTNFHSGKLVHLGMEFADEVDYDMREAVRLADVELARRHMEEFGTILGMEDNPEVMDLRPFVEDIMQHYIMWENRLEEEDDILAMSNFEFVTREHELLIEIRPGYTISLYLDALVRHKQTNEYYILEYKTAKNIDTFQDELGLDWQPILYREAIEKHFGFTISGVLYTLFRKKVPVFKTTAKTKKVSENAQLDITPEWFIYKAKQYYAGVHGREFTASEIREMHEEYFSKIYWKNKDKYFYRFIYNPLQDVGIFMDDTEGYNQFNNIWPALKETLDDMKVYKGADIPASNPWECKSCQFKDYCNNVNLYGAEKAQKVLDLRFRKAKVSKDYNGE